MANIEYLSEQNFRDFITVLKDGEYRIKKYLPPVNQSWYKKVAECSEYVAHVSQYEGGLSFRDMCARLLYKVVKKHELSDGNKRTGVITIYLFCLVNNYYILNPEDIKKQAKRIAATKGRGNEELMRRRVSKSMEDIIYSESEFENHLTKISGK